MTLVNRTIEIRVPSQIWFPATLDVPKNLTQPVFIESAYNISVVTKQTLYNAGKVALGFKAAVNALNTYAVPVICVFGIAGDATSFLVFVFSSFRYQPCSQYLAALTFVDTLFLVSQLINSLMNFFPSLALSPGYCSVMVYMSYVCSFLSVWFVVLMMLERYIVVCHPLRALTIWSKKKAINLITALALLSLLLYSHSFFTTTKSATGRTCAISGDFYDFLIIFTYIDAVLVFVVPFLALVCLNLRIILTIRKYRLQHNVLNHSILRLPRYHNADKTLTLAQVRSTKMLIWVSSVFIVLYLPSYATRLYGLIIQQLQHNEISESSRFRLHVAQQICQFLYYVNFAIDFIVYVMTSQSFRRDVTPCLRHIHL